MITLNALASAGLWRLPDGEWTLHSRFSRAINFVHDNGELLTLYRYGNGIGPAGVLLGENAFSRCAALSHIVKRNTRIAGSGVTICLRRQLALRLTAAMMSPIDLRGYCSPTGLCGPLNQAIAWQPPHTDADLARWLIGRGPGLTPSGDDMLIGMLAVFHAAGLPVAAFLPPADQLAALTTSVSCSYLNSARVGEFATPVLRVMRCLQRGRAAHRAIQRLLSLGHTSGADTLLGIALAQRGLSSVEFRGMNARSGNHTHIYSGG